MALVLTVLATVLGPAGVSAAGTAIPAPAGASPQDHEPCHPDTDNDCDQSGADDQDPCDANDNDCTRDDAKDEKKGNDEKKEKDEKKGKDGKGKDGDAENCDPDDHDCETKDPGDEEGGGDSDLTEILKNLVDR